MRGQSWSEGSRFGRYKHVAAAELVDFPAECLSADFLAFLKRLACVEEAVVGSDENTDAAQVINTSATSPSSSC